MHADGRSAEVAISTVIGISAWLNKPIITSGDGSSQNVQGRPPMLCVCGGGGGGGDVPNSIEIEPRFNRTGNSGPTPKIPGRVEDQSAHCSCSCLFFIFFMRTSWNHRQSTSSFSRPTPLLISRRATIAAPGFLAPLLVCALPV